MRACGAGGAGLLPQTYQSFLFATRTPPCPAPYLPVFLHLTFVAFPYLGARGSCQARSREHVCCNTFFLVNSNGERGHRGSCWTHAERAVVRVASPPPPPTYSPGAVVGRAFPPHLAYEYALKARVDRGAEEFYVAVAVGDCVLVDQCDGAWALITHERGIQGWIPAAFVDR